MNRELRASLEAPPVKSSPAMWETWVQSLGREIPCRRAWQPTPVFFPGESHRQRTLAGYSPQSHKQTILKQFSTHAWNTKIFMVWSLNIQLQLCSVSCTLCYPSILSNCDSLRLPLQTSFHFLNTFFSLAAKWEVLLCQEILQMKLIFEASPNFLHH